MARVRENRVSLNYSTEGVLELTVLSEDDFEPCNSKVKCWNYSHLLLHPTINPYNV